MRRAPWVWPLLAAWSAGSAWASDAGVAAEPSTAPTVSARVDKEEARVGDLIVLTLTAVGPKSAPVNLPRAVDLGAFSELDDQDRRVEEKDLGDGKMRWEMVLSIAAYEPGELSVPSLPVTYLGPGGEVLTARTQPIAVRIVSVLANEPEPQLKENAPPVKVLARDLLLVYLAGGLAAAAFGALAAGVIRRRLRARASARPPPPPRPPHEVALDRLDSLGARGLSEGADLRPFYFELSEVIRAYLGQHFGFDSLELTTEELVDELRRRVTRDLPLTEVTVWLSTGDLVKFAKVSPSMSEARGALETAIRIVESTRPRPQPIGVGEPPTVTTAGGPA